MNSGKCILIWTEKLIYTCTQAHLMVQFPPSKSWLLL